MTFINYDDFSFCFHPPSPRPLSRSRGGGWGCLSFCSGAAATVPWSPPAMASAAAAPSTHWEATYPRAAASSPRA